MSDDESNGRVTLALLNAGQKEILRRLGEYHLELKEHIAKDEAEFEPLKVFKTRVYGGLVIIGAMLSFLGWDAVKRFFVIEVIK